MFPASDSQSASSLSGFQAMCFVSGLIQKSQRKQFLPTNYRSFMQSFRRVRLSMKARARELRVTDIKTTQDETFSFNMFIFLMRKVLISDFW